MWVAWEFKFGDSLELEEACDLQVAEVLLFLRPGIKAFSVTVLCMTCLSWLARSVFCKCMPIFWLGRPGVL